MKIIMTLMSLDIGGAETHVAELSKQLVKMGHEVIIVAEKGAYWDHLASSGVRLVRAPLDRRDLRSMLASYRILKTVIKKEKPETNPLRFFIVGNAK